MCPGVLGQSLSRPLNHLVRDCFRAGSPTLVSMFIDIAMITGEITSAVNLQNDFTERDRGSCHSVSLAIGTRCVGHA